jgi:hypothetical protein
MKGVVSSTSPEYRVVIETGELFDVVIDLQNFYTNGTPIYLEVTTYGQTSSVDELMNTTSEPIRETAWANHAGWITISIQYVRNTTFFSCWVLVRGVRADIPPPVTYPNPYTVPAGSFIIGSIFLGGGLFLFWHQKRGYASRDWDKALVLCTLGVLLLSLGFPSLAGPYSYLYYHPLRNTSFGEFTSTVTQAEPRVNTTMRGLRPGEGGVYGFHVTNATVTLHVISIDGSLEYTWYDVSAKYPNYQFFEFDTTGDTVVEVIREDEDTSFRCWLLANDRFVEVRRTPAANYIIFAFIFFEVGAVLFVLSFIFIIKGFKEYPLR